MKRKSNYLIYAFVIVCAFTMLATSCKKDENNSNVPVALAPNVATIAMINIGTTTATGGGTVLSDSGSAVTARGVCWGTSQNPTIAGNKTTDGSGTGSFTSNLTGLAPNTT